MTCLHAVNFLTVGLAMAAGPAVWPEHFAADQMRSAAWLVSMGSLQAATGMCVLLVILMRRLRRLVAWVEESLEFPIDLTDLHRAVLPGSLYSLAEETEEVSRALRLQRQLLRAR